MNQQSNLQGLFERPTTLPDPDAQGRLARLVGMDDKIKRLANVLGVLINPTGLRKWQDKHHADAGALLDAVIRRPPLVVLSGDVGSGKTELAETIGDKVARQEDIDITLLPLSRSSTRSTRRVNSSRPRAPHAAASSCWSMKPTPWHSRVNPTRCTMRIAQASMPSYAASIALRTGGFLPWC